MLKLNRRVFDLSPAHLKSTSTLNRQPTQHSIVLLRWSRLEKPTRTLKPDDYYHEFFLDGISIGAGTRPKTVTDSWNSAVDPDDHPDQICQDEKVIKSLGTIQINITRCTALVWLLTAGLAPVSTCQQPFPAQLWTPIARDPAIPSKTEGLIKPEIIIEVDSDKENECKKEKTKQENINGNNKRIKSEEGDQKKNRADLKDKKPKIVDLTLSDDSD
ncbi:hypothetical protein H4Q26_016512 [Puccinia striiformis f. sp. tritici PST-130]|nr:hypothetical protein H4Q26_016512 [Puccinia striiformis f. sp. tritici PST-130]